MAKVLSWGEGRVRFEFSKEKLLPAKLREHSEKNEKC